VSCFVVAPPYRRHGVAGALLDRVVADAGGRGLGWVEAYPDTEPDTAGAPPFRGRRAMYDERGFEPVGEEGSHVIVRRRA
jgi:GNAT superfamily N-acetyltransferase